MDEKQMLQEIIDYAGWKNLAGEKVKGILTKPPCDGSVIAESEDTYHVFEVIWNLEVRKKVFGEGARRMCSRGMAILETRQEQLAYLHSFLPPKQ